MNTCIKHLVNYSHCYEEFPTRLYCQLGIVLKTSEHFFSNNSVVLVASSQIITVTMWWTVLKCWNVIPSVLTFTFLWAGIFCPFGVLMIMFQKVEIFTTSKKFIEYKRSKYHTFSKYNKNRYFFLHWNSQRILAKRLKEQLTFNQTTLRKYVSVLIENVTNAVLLINP